MAILFICIIADKCVSISLLLNKSYPIRMHELIVADGSNQVLLFYSSIYVIVYIVEAIALMHL